MINYAILIEKAQSGDKEAFGVIYSELYAPVFRYAYIRTRNNEHSEDIAAEVFLKFYSALDSYSSQKESPLPYLFTITRNLLINDGKKKKTELFEDGAEEQIRDTTRGQMDKSILDEDVKHIMSKMSELAPDQREVIELKFLSELSSREIAELLSKSEANVRQLESRGLRRLRELCNETD